MGEHNIFRKVSNSFSTYGHAIFLKVSNQDLFCRRYRPKTLRHFLKNSVYTYEGVIYPALYAKTSYIRFKEERTMPLKVEIEYIEDPDDAGRLRDVAKILSEGVYVYLKKEGLLRLDPKRAQKVREILDYAREIINKDTGD